MKWFVFLFALFTLSADAADVRFSNHSTNVQVILAPYNGNKIAVYDPTPGTWSDETIGNVTADVTTCYVDDVASQNMAYSTLYLAFLKKDTSGNHYLNFLPWSLAGSIKNSDGIYVDARTQHGHMVGMLIRMPTYELQGQANSEYVLSYYNRGHTNFVSVPAGTVAAASGWVAVGPSVDTLVWADDTPQFSGVINFTGNTANASLEARIIIYRNDPTTGVISSTPNDWGYATQQVNVTPGKQYTSPIFAPLAAPPPGFWRYQLEIRATAGNVVLGALQNSMIAAYGPF